MRISFKRKMEEVNVSIEDNHHEEYYEKKAFDEFID